MPGMSETGCWWYLNFADGGRFLGAQRGQGREMPSKTKS